MSSSSDNIFSLAASNLNIVAGATNAVLVNAVAYQSSVLVKFISGGSLEIIQAGVPVSGESSAAAATLTPAQLATASGKGYPVTVSESINISGPATFYLAAYGSTAVVGILKGLSDGT